MTSNRKLAANRRNAARATGPRSAAGKARASRNALRHGLAISVAELPAAAVEIDRITRAIVREGDDTVALHYARAAAVAELEVLRVRAARAALINQLARDRRLFVPKPMPPHLILLQVFRRNPDPSVLAAFEENRRKRSLPIPEDPERMIVAFARAAPDLAKYDRYERRALSRRKSALRALDSMRDRALPAAAG